MNLQEFAGLKVGDEVINHMSNDGLGIVTVVNANGIKVRWPPSAMDWTFTNQSTAWMHWSKKTDDTKPDTATQDGAQVEAGASKGVAQS